MIGWIAFGALFIWYGLTMWRHARQQNYLASYTALLFLNDEMYESYRREFREWIAGADVDGDTLSCAQPD